MQLPIQKRFPPQVSIHTMNTFQLIDRALSCLEFTKQKDWDYKTVNGRHELF